LAKLIDTTMYSAVHALSPSGGVHFIPVCYVFNKIY